MGSKETSLAPAFNNAPAPRGKGGKASADPAPAPQEPTGVAGVAKRTSTAVKRLEASKLAMQRTGTSVLHTGETLGSLFLSSMAEGFFGQEKLKLGGIDLRAPVGLATQAFGLYQIMTDEKAGEHALSVGNGVTGSWLASVGREAGEALRERKDGGPGRGTLPQPPAQAPGSGGTAFKGEPMVYFPPAGAPAYQGALPPAPVQLGALPAGYPQPGPGYGYAPAYHPGAGYGPAAGYGYAPGYGAAPGYVPGYGAAPGHTPGYGAAPGAVPGYGAAPGYAPTQAPGADSTPGYGQAPSYPTGLLPEPAPRMSGLVREVMMTPEQESVEGPLPPTGPQMMITPEAAPEGPFQGPRMMLSPDARARFQQGAPQRQQRRAAIAQGFQQARQGRQAQLQQAQQDQPQPGEDLAPPELDPALAGGGEQDVEVGRGRFRAARVQQVFNRFPSADALSEQPEE